MTLGLLVSLSFDRRHSLDLRLLLLRKQGPTIGNLVSGESCESHQGLNRFFIRTNCENAGLAAPLPRAVRCVGPLQLIIASLHDWLWDLDRDGRHKGV